MKNLKYLAIVAILGSGLFVSCTPESIEDGQTEQQIHVSKIKAPRQG